MMAWYLQQVLMLFIWGVLIRVAYREVRSFLLEWRMLEEMEAAGGAEAAGRPVLRGGAVRPHPVRCAARNRRALLGGSVGERHPVRL